MESPYLSFSHSSPFSLSSTKTLSIKSISISTTPILLLFHNLPIPVLPRAKKSKLRQEKVLSFFFWLQLPLSFGSFWVWRSSFLRVFPSQKSTPVVGQHEEEEEEEQEQKEQEKRKSLREREREVDGRKRVWAVIIGRELNHWRWRALVECGQQHSPRKHGWLLSVNPGRRINRLPAKVYQENCEHATTRSLSNINTNIYISLSLSCTVVFPL